jgi:tRNA(adenine34) deaminase
VKNMDIEQKMMITIEEARRSLASREFPVGGVIFFGNEIIGQAHSSGESHLEFLQHAEMAALLKADKMHFTPSQRKQMQLFTTLEPCLMCLGAAMSFYIGEIYYAMESPIDGAVNFASQFWRNNRREIPEYDLPGISGGLLRERGKDILREYLALVPDGPLVEFSKILIRL